MLAENLLLPVSLSHHRTEAFMRPLRASERSVVYAVACQSDTSRQHELITDGTMYTCDRYTVRTTNNIVISMSLCKHKQRFKICNSFIPLLYNSIHFNLSCLFGALKKKNCLRKADQNNCSFFGGQTQSAHGNGLSVLPFHCFQQSSALRPRVKLCTFVSNEMQGVGVCFPPGMESSDCFWCGLV